MTIETTRLRWISSKDHELIQTYVADFLHYKIEIKSINVLKGKWFLWYVLPENEHLKELPSGNLD